MVSRSSVGRKEGRAASREERRRAGRQWGPGETGGGPGRRGFRAAAGAQGDGGGVCECMSVGGRVCA